MKKLIMASLICLFCASPVFAQAVQINDNGSVTVDCSLPGSVCEPYTINFFWGSINGFLVKVPSAVSSSEYIDWAQKYRKRVPGKQIPTYTDTTTPIINFSGNFLTVNQDYLSSYSSFGRTLLQLFAEVKNDKGQTIVRGMSESQYAQVLEEYSNWLLNK